MGAYEELMAGNKSAVKRNGDTSTGTSAYDALMSSTPQSSGNLATDIPKGVARGILGLPEAVASTAQTALGGYAKMADLAVGNENAGQGGAIENTVNSAMGTARDYTTRPLENWAKKAMPYSGGTQEAQGKLGTDLEAITADNTKGIGQKVGEAFKATIENPRGTLPSLIESIPQFIAGSAMLKGAKVAEGLAGVGKAEELTAKAAEATARANRLGVDVLPKMSAGAVNEAKALTAQAAKADMVQNAAIMSLGNATLEGAGASKAAHDEIIGLARTNPEQLMKNPQFAQLANERGFDEAVRITAEQAGNTAYAPAAGLGAAASLVTGGGLEGQIFNRLTGKAATDAIGKGIAPTLKAVTKGAAVGGLKEGVEETAQGASGQFAQNLAVQPYTGVDLSQGVAEQAASGGAMGLLSGGVGSGVGRAYDKVTKPSLEDEQAKQVSIDRVNSDRAVAHAKAIDDAHTNGNALQAALLRATPPTPIDNSVAQRNADIANGVNSKTSERKTANSQSARDNFMNGVNQPNYSLNPIDESFKQASDLASNGGSQGQGGSITATGGEGTNVPTEPNKTSNKPKDTPPTLAANSGKPIVPESIPTINVMPQTVQNNREDPVNEIPTEINSTPDAKPAKANPESGVMASASPKVSPANAEKENAGGVANAGAIDTGKESQVITSEPAKAKKSGATPKNNKQSFVTAYVNTENRKADKKTRTSTEKARDNAEFTQKAQDEYDNRIVTALNNGEKLSTKAEIPDHGLTLEEFSAPLQPSDNSREAHNEAIAEAKSRGLVIRNQTQSNNDTKTNTTTTTTTQPTKQRADTNSPATGNTGAQGQQAEAVGVDGKTDKQGNEKTTYIAGKFRNKSEVIKLKNELESKLDSLIKRRGESFYNPSNDENDIIGTSVSRFRKYQNGDVYHIELEDEISKTSNELNDSIRELDAEFNDIPNGYKKVIGSESVRYVKTNDQSTNQSTKETTEPQAVNSRSGNFPLPEQSTTKGGKNGKETPTKTQVLNEAGDAKQAVEPATNTVFTEDMANAARERLRAKLGRLNSGVDPEMFADGIVLAGYHIEKGARTFAAYVKAMLADMGDEIIPYLKQFYAGVALDPRSQNFSADMDDLGEMQKADLDALIEKAKEEIRAEKSKAEAAIPKAQESMPEANSNSPENEVVKSAIDNEAHKAATSPLNDTPQPTPAQNEAGNYKKGHITLHGLNIAIENPKGSERSGIDGKGKAWTVKMAHHYGYIKGTIGNDNDHVDVFIGNNPESEKVFVVNQINPDTGKFDEHKILLGFNSMSEAKAGYSANYSKGWKGGDDISEMSLSELKNKVSSGKLNKPIKAEAKQSKSATQTLHSLIASGNVNAVLEHILANSATQLHQILANKLIGQLPNGINIAIADTLKNKRGTEGVMNYDYGTKTVSVNLAVIPKLKESSVEKGFIHELIHAVTGEKINAIMGNTDESTLTRDEKVARTQLKLIANLINKHVKENNVTGDLKKVSGLATENLRELITYGLTEPIFQKMLADIKMGKDKTAWTQFVHAIAKLLGIELNQEQESALSALLMVGDSLLGNEKATPSTDTQAVSDKSRIEKARAENFTPTHKMTLDNGDVIDVEKVGKNYFVDKDGKKQHYLNYAKPIEKEIDWNRIEDHHIDIREALSKQLYKGFDDGSVMTKTVNGVNFKVEIETDDFGKSFANVIKEDKDSHTWDNPIKIPMRINESPSKLADKIHDVVVDLSGLKAKDNTQAADKIALNFFTNLGKAETKQERQKIIDALDHPNKDRLIEIEQNYIDIIGELEDAGIVEVNGCK